MTEKMLKQFAHKMAAARIVPGPRGSFEVKVNGKEVFSKLATGRFPDLAEVRDAIKAAM